MCSGASAQLIMTGQRTPWWFDVDVTCSGGEHLCVPFHAVHYVSAAVVHWEITGPLSAVRRCAYLDVGRCIREERATWLTLFMRLGGEKWNSLLHASERAVLHSQRRRGARSDAPESCSGNDFTRSTFMIDTQGLLGLLAHWSAHRKFQDSRAKASELLEAFLCKCLECESAHPLLQAALDNMDNTCQDGVLENSCKHVRHVLASCETARPPQRRLAMVLRLCLRLIWGCDSARSLATELIQVIAASIEHGIDNCGFSDRPLKNEAVLLRGHSKRRISEEYKQEVVDTLLKKHKVHNGGSPLKLDGIDARRLNAWQHQKLADHLVCAQREFGQLRGTFNMASDSARLGAPAEETTVYLLSHPGAGLSTYMPNQVPCRCPKQPQVRVLSMFPFCTHLSVLWGVCKFCCTRLSANGCHCFNHKNVFRRRICVIVMCMSAYVQALPDYRGMACEHDGSGLTEPNKVRWAARCQNFLTVHRDREQQVKKQQNSFFGGSGLGEPAQSEGTRSCAAGHIGERAVFVRGGGTAKSSAG